MGKPVVFFEIAVDNLERCSQFYRDVFGWEISGEKKDYQMFKTAEGGIDGGIMPNQPDKFPPYVSIYIEVEDLPQYLETTRSLGGKVIVEPMSLPCGSQFAMIMDPDNNCIGLFKGV